MLAWLQTRSGFFYPMKRNSTIFYRSFYEAIKDLDEQQQLVVYNAIFKYTLDGELSDLKGIPGTIFKLILPQLEANNSKYLNGKKGGRKPNNNLNETKQEPNYNLNETKVEANVNDNVNDNVNVNDNDNVVLLPQNFAHTIRTIFYEENPDYPVSEKLDIRPAREIFEFLTSQGYKGLELFNYWRELARRRREVEFYKDKPLKIISSQIQGLYEAVMKPKEKNSKTKAFVNFTKIN